MRRFVSLVLLVMLLAACSGSPAAPDATPLPGDPPPTDATNTPATDEGGKVTISFAAWEYERQIYEPLAKKFSEENPNIEVVLVPLDDLMNVSGPNGDYSPFGMLRRVVSGADTAPAAAASPETLGSSLLLDLTAHMDADSSFKRDDFYPGALEQYTIKGATRVLPRYLYVQTLSYNKDLFKSAGVPEPKPGWTWNDLFGVAQQIAGSGGDNYGLFDASNGFTPLYARLKSQGTDLMTLQSSATKLDDQVFVEGIQYVKSLIENRALNRVTFQAMPADGPVKDPQQVEDPNQLIRDGKIGIWPSETLGNGGPRPIDAGPNGGGTEDLPFAVGTIPYPADNFAPYINVDGYIISSGTEHPAEAWKWIEFLSRQQTEQQNPGGPVGFKQPGRIPARVSIAEEQGFWNDLDAQTADAYKWAIAHPNPPIERMPDYTLFGPLSQALEQVLGSEKKDPQKALQEAQKQLDQLLAEQVNTTPTPTPNLGPVAVATPEPQVAPEGATTIKFSSFAYNPPDLRRLARSFRDQRPDIFVNVTSTDVYTQGPTIAQIANTNDCFAWYSVPQSDEDFNALLDLQPFFDADASFPQNDYPAALLAPYQREGKLYGLPYAATLRSLNYNKTAFGAAGIQAPTGDWKPDDFLAAAQALSKGEGDRQQFGYVPLGGAQQDLFFFINQFGGQLTTGSGKDTRPNFTDPKAMQAIKWYLDLWSVHKVMPKLTFPYKTDDTFEDRSYEYIQNGRAGMWFGQGDMSFGDPSSPQPFEMGVAPLPIGLGGLRSGDMFVRGMHISAKTEQSQACWEWLKFLSADTTNLQGGMPARNSILSSDGFTSQASPAMLDLVKIYADVLKRAPSGSSSGSDPNQLYTMDTYWFFKALMDAVNDKAPLDQGLAEAQKNTSAWLDCMAQTPNKPATCAQKVDPTYKGYNTEDPPPGGFGAAKG